MARRRRLGLNLPHRTAPLHSVFLGLGHAFLLPLVVRLAEVIEEGLVVDELHAAHLLPRQLLDEVREVVVRDLDLFTSRIKIGLKSD